MFAACNAKHSPTHSSLLWPSPRLQYHQLRVAPQGYVTACGCYVCGRNFAVALRSYGTGYTPQTGSQAEWRHQGEAVSTDADTIHLYLVLPPSHSMPISTRVRTGAAGPCKCIPSADTLPASLEVL